MGLPTPDLVLGLVSASFYTETILAYARLGSSISAVEMAARESYISDILREWVTASTNKAHNTKQTLQKQEPASDL